jgi:hypothetical protein
MLTGTPLQNDLMELHNLLSFLLPGLFKDSQESEDQNFGEFWASARVVWAVHTLTLILAVALCAVVQDCAVSGAA